MSEEVGVKRKIYPKIAFSSVVDTEFNQLVPSDANNTIDDKTLDKLFEYYNELYYDIPNEGDTNSHLYLVNKSSEALGISYQDLLTELRQLREENVSLKNQLFQITK